MVTSVGSGCPFFPMFVELDESEEGLLVLFRKCRSTNGKHAAAMRTSSMGDHVTGEEALASTPTAL